MLCTYLLFPDALLASKIAELVKDFNSEGEIKKILEIDQIITQDKHPIFIITNFDNYQKIEQTELWDMITKTFVIDDIENEELENIFFINDKKQLITNFSAFWRKSIREVLGSQNHVPLNIKHFNETQVYPVEIHLKLGTSKYIKILNSGNSFSDNGLTKLLEKGVKYLYVTTEDFDNISDILHKKSMQGAKEFKPIEEHVGAIEIIHDFMLDFGFDEKTLQMTKKIQGDLAEKYTSKFMRTLFDRFQKMEGSFLYNHSYLTGVLALTVAKKYTWMNADNKEKLFLGAMLHDLGYKDKDNAFKENLPQSEIKKLDPKTQEDILGHPARFAQQLQQINDIHQDVIKIVKDHHSIYEENSYPNKIYPNEVNLIFALFTVCHDFALNLYKVSFNKDKIPQVMQATCDRFDRGNFKKILPEFIQTIDEMFLSDF